MLKHEDWPGLEKITTLRALEREGAMRGISILCGNGGLFLDFEIERGADGAMTGYCFPDMLVDVVRLAAATASATPRTTCSTRTCRCCATSSSRASGWRCASTCWPRRGVISSDAQRSPAGKLSAAARAEVDYLLERLARHDPRASLAPPGPR